MKKSKNAALYERARMKIPGSVNSPVRAWKAVGANPIFISRAKGPFVHDVEGRKYIDYVGSWGPLIVGHAHPAVIQTISATARHGTTFGAPTENEVRLAEAVSLAVPSIEKLRLVSSGTEAAMSALRLARAYTGRSKIIKFDGCYHGHSDGLLVRAGSGAATFCLPDSPGVPRTFARETLVAKFNDLNSVTRLFRRHPGKIAAIIVEPVCGNMGVIQPRPGFLAGLRLMTRRAGALLIFDEVITGFRVAYGGAQDLLGVKPDITCLGKILGGGLPLGGFGGRGEIMDWLAPEGPVYQAGTLSGNPIAVCAGLVTLQLLKRAATYQALERKGQYLERGFRRVLSENAIKAAVNRVGSMMTIFFGVDEVTNPDQARRCDREQFARFFRGMLEGGIYLPPAPFEAMFISVAHEQRELDRTLAAFSRWARKEAQLITPDLRVRS